MSEKGPRGAGDGTSRTGRRPRWEAYSLVERGVATVADVDTAIANGPELAGRADTEIAAARGRLVVGLLAAQAEERDLP